MSLRVLVVDDEPFIVTGLQVFLEDEGMQVNSAGSGEEAVDIARNDSSFDVCIMDMTPLAEAVAALASGRD